MKKLLDSMRLNEMLDYMGYGKSLVFIFLGAMVVTYLFHRFFKGQRWVKYVPGLAMLIFGLYSLTRIDIASSNFIQDDSITSFVTGVAGGLATLLFGLILGVFNKPKKVKKKRRKVEAEDLVSPQKKE